MHIPNDRVSRAMRGEAASLWTVSANAGAEIAVLIKVPSATIKALVAGCSLQLLLGRLGPHVCLGARIEDVPDAPIRIAYPIRDPEDLDALMRLLSDRTSKVFLFNEMDVCIAWTTLSFGEAEARQAQELLGDRSALYSGPYTPEYSHALDCFCQSTDATDKYPNAVAIPIAVLTVSMEPWQITRVSFIGLRESHTVILDDSNEGEMFERAIWACLESVFPVTLYKSPQVADGAGKRELTDVLAFHEYGSFLIEAKDLSVIEAGFARSQERRVKGVQKQIHKAIGQLEGAWKAVKRGEEVSDSGGQLLAVVRDKPAHCIVLVTELMQFGEWGDVADRLFAAMKNTGAFFHLLDLRELIVLLKGSRGNPALLDFNLMNRAALFAKERNVHIRSQIVPGTS